MDFGVILGDIHIIKMQKQKMLCRDPQDVFLIETNGLKLFVWAIHR